MNKLWLYLHFSDLFLNHQRCSEGTALAILLPSDLRVHACNSKAKKAGIQQDMSLPTALSLCPDLRTQLLDSEQEQQFLTQEALWAYQFSAQICLDPPEGMWLEIGSMLKLFNGMENLWQQMQANRDTRIPIQMACSHIPVQARFLARAGLGKPSSDKFWIRQQLDNLPLSALPDGLVNPLKLQRIGAKKLGDLLKLPPSGLATRYGKELFILVQQLNGNLPTPMRWFEIPLHFEQKAFFIEEIEHLGGLIFQIRPLLQALAHLMKKHQSGTRRLHLELKHRDRDPTQWAFGFAQASASFEELLTLTRYELNKQTLPAPVTELTLKVEQFEERTGLQEDYWPHSRSQGQSCSPEQSRGSLLNRLQARLDSHQVYQLQLIGDARPEMAGQLRSQSLSSSHTRSLNQSFRLNPFNLTQLNLTRLQAERPTWMLEPPCPWVKPAAGERVTPYPERIASGWWGSLNIRRDYYQVLQNGQLLWLFRDHQARWFLHGWFG